MELLEPAVLCSKTDGRASCLGNNESPFTNVVGKLEKGKWKVHPKLLDNGCTIERVTVGSGIFSGNEFGHITADFELGEK